ncbi:hypothetical protein KKF84_22560 [Myxococcota bacterium]|nr:hypothetical protein [Myxococcota bacterium]MBU1538112.1 hypothetical protein [Myxococcota bacterium]
MSPSRKAIPIILGALLFSIFALSGCIARKRSRSRAKRNLSAREPTVEELKRARAARKFLHTNRPLFRNRHLARLCALRGLRDLDLSNTAVNSRGLRCLLLMRRLEYLNLSGTKIDDAAFVTLSELKHLAILNVSKTAVSGWKFDLLPRMTRLERLNISGNRIALQTLNYLGGAPSLKRLSARNMAGPVSLDFLRSTKLTHLDISGSSIGGSQLLHLATAKQLVGLNVSHIPIDKGVARAIGQLKNLQELYAAQCSIQSSFAQYFFQSSHLRVLDLYGNGVRGEVLNHLAKTPRLQRLTLSGSSFIKKDILAQKVWFSRAIFRGLPMARIPWPKTMRVLELPLSDMDDKNLGFLKMLPELKVLDLRQTLVTQAKIRELQTQYPGLKLSWIPLLAGTLFIHRQVTPTF